MRSSTAGSNRTAASGKRSHGSLTKRLAGVAMMVDQVVMLGTLAALLLLATGREQRRRDDEGRLDDSPQLTVRPPT